MEIPSTLCQLLVSAMAVSALGLSQPLLADYRIINFGTLGGTNARTNAINDQGQVVGNSDTSTGNANTQKPPKAELPLTGIIGRKLADFVAWLNFAQSHAVLWESSCRTHGQPQHAHHGQCDDDDGGSNGDLAQ